MLSISQSWSQRLEVNCVPRSEVIVSSIPKREIQVKVKSFSACRHGCFWQGNSFHPFGCAVNNSENIGEMGAETQEMAIKMDYDLSKDEKLDLRKNDGNVWLLPARPIIWGQKLNNAIRCLWVCMKRIQGKISPFGQVSRVPRARTLWRHRRTWRTESQCAAGITVADHFSVVITCSIRTENRCACQHWLFIAFCSYLILLPDLCSNTPISFCTNLVCLILNSMRTTMP